MELTLAKALLFVSMGLTIVTNAHALPIYYSSIKDANTLISLP